jgi:hypothetical protein
MLQCTWYYAHGWNSRKLTFCLDAIAENPSTGADNKKNRPKAAF